MRISRRKDTIPAASQLLDYLVDLQSGNPARAQHLVGTGYVAELEAKLRLHYGKRYAVAVCNATTGLLVAGLAIGLRRGDHFVTTPYTYPATVSPWMGVVGAMPVFSDIDPRSLTLDPEGVGQSLTDRTRAILCVDADGVPADTGSLKAVAKRFDVPLVLDAAQSLGATRDGEPAGRHADVIVCSFTVGKPLSAGEGGAILTDDGRIYRRILQLCQHPDRQRAAMSSLAIDEFSPLNARICPLAAIVAGERFVDSMRDLRAKQSSGAELVEKLNESGCVRIPPYSAMGIVPSYFRLTVGIEDEAARKRMLDGLRSRDIDIELQPLSADLLFKRPSFLGRYRRRLGAEPDCPVAEEELRRRYLVRAPWREVLRWADAAAPALGSR